MAEGNAAGRWGDRVRQAEAQAQAGVAHAVTYLNERVVPEIRRDGLRTLRAAAAELRLLAAALDAAAGAKGDQTP